MAMIYKNTVIFDLCLYIYLYAAPNFYISKWVITTHILKINTIFPMGNAFK